MISEIIKAQLKKCAFADLSHYDESANVYHIPKYTKPKYDVGRCYLIRVSKNILNNPTSLLATNWNNGNYPKAEYYKAYVNKTMGSYIYVDCLAYNYETKQDLTEMFSGWLDINELQQLFIVY